ncbi:MAG TPA: polysaccharide pyruvyl transferase family protein [Candidatus Acidoferrum sp.]|nr:polysaccharide pyruvyl transferase family protein [Candidatus Acidoferrum sp.]
MNRRSFLKQSTLATSIIAALPEAIAASRRPRILLRSSWQVVNIGDIAHTPGVLALLEKHIPETEVMLWASGDLTPAVAEMEHKRFPKLRIVKGSIRADGKASSEELGEAIAWADFLLHGSGASLVAAKDVATFVKHTGKPFGVYGITHGSFLSGNDKEILNQAKFVFFRDSVSLEKARSEGVKAAVMDFGPDGAFACDLRDDASATAFLRANKLEDGGFVCCIPRLRYTPYWKIRGTPMTDEQRRRARRNDELKEHDHAPLREAIIAVIRETGMKVLLCPEDQSQMDVGREMIFDKLPAAVRDKVVWREKFWLTDEALSTYVRSAGLFGLEMHSPIMCIGNGVPAIVGRFEEQTSKGFMWRDIGLGEWLFDFDNEAEIKRFAPAVLEMVKHPDAAKRKARQALTFVRERQAATMAVLRKQLT